VKTYVPKRDEMKHKWVIIDAEDKVLGHVAVEAARVLRGKHRADYTPHAENGDFVIIVNAAKARMSGKKRTDKKYYDYSGFMGGMKETTYERMLAKHPTRPMELAVKGMLPHSPLGRALLRHLRVYAGSEHDQVSQKPVPHPIP